MAPGLTITTDELVAAIAKCRSTLEHVWGWLRCWPQTVHHVSGMAQLVTEWFKVSEYVKQSD